MQLMDLELSKEILKNANSQNGLGYLEWYGGHNVWHPGYDLNHGFGDQDLGLPILCPHPGIVEYVSPFGYNKGFGLHVIIKHPDLNRWTHYAHLASTNLHVGQKIKYQDTIGSLGKTGTTSAHTHFEVWKDKLYNIQINPPLFYKKYHFYPTKWERSKVMEYYEDPAIFLALTKNLNKKKEVFKIPNWDGLKEAIEWNKNLEYPIINKINTIDKCIQVLEFHRFSKNFNK